MSFGTAGGVGTAGCPVSRPQPVKAALNAISSMHFPFMASLECEQVFQRHADEYGHSEIVVVEEGAKAGIAIARAYQPQLINEEQRPHP